MAAETEIERLLVRLVGDATSYQRMLNEAAKASRKAGDEVEKAGQRMERIAERLKRVGLSMRRVGKTMSLAITAPLAAIGGLSVRGLARFDQAMTESTSIMKVTEAQIKSMQETAIELSAGGALLQGPTDLAKAYFFLASAGKDAEQSMSLLPKVAAFATAGAFDMALATDLLTDAQSALGMTRKNVTEDTKNLVKVSDLLVGANTLANASVQQFATSLTTKAGSAFKAYNIRLEEGIGLLLAYADQGIKAELAGNAADRMIRLLTKAARDNASVFKQHKVKVFDDAGEFRTFEQIIGDLERALRGMSTEQKSATLELLGFEARVQSVILPLLDSSEAIGTYVEKLNDMKGITEEVAEKQMKSFSNQMKVLKNQLSIVGIEIGEVLAPILLSLNELVKSGIESWRGLSDTSKRFIVISGLIVTAIGPLLIALAAVVTLAGAAVTALGTLAAVAGPVIGVLTGPAGIAALTLGGTALAGGAFLASNLSGAGGANDNARRKLENDRKNAIVERQNAINRAKRAARDAAKAAEKEKIDAANAALEKERRVAVAEAKKVAEEAEKARKKIMEEGAGVTEEFLSPQERFLKRQGDLKRLLDAGAISMTTYSRAIKAAREELEGMNKAIDISRVAAGIQAVEFGSAAARTRLAAHRAMLEQVGAGRLVGGPAAAKPKIPVGLGRARDEARGIAPMPVAERGLDTLAPESLLESAETIALIERIAVATETQASKRAMEDFVEIAGFDE